MQKRDVYRIGHLTTRQKEKIFTDEVSIGTHALELNKNKDTLLYVPRHYHHSQPALLAVMLHGAGGNAEHGLSYLQHHADEHNIILLAPASKAYSWDIIASENFGPDVVLIDQALHYVFQHYHIDRRRRAIGGFSDGASYALSIGLGNGDLFTHIIAFSPGFYYTHEKQGRPVVFISHGVNDNVLPIDPCSRRIVRSLQKERIDAVYKEFNGRHEIPALISKEAVDWFLKSA
jgi:predicted esterase